MPARTLETALEVAGPMRVVLYAASTTRDTDFFLKLSDQMPSDGAASSNGLNPRFEVVSRGWLRASHRALDATSTTTEVPVHKHDREEPLTPGTIYRFEISLEPQAYYFAAGHRIRLEISNSDSPVTEALWPHFYRPDRIGVDTFHHGAEYPSCLVLPVNGSALNVPVSCVKRIGAGPTKLLVACRHSVAVGDTAVTAPMPFGPAMLTVLPFNRTKLVPAELTAMPVN